MVELEKPRLSNADRSLPAISSGELRPESLLVALGETPIKTFEFKTLGKSVHELCKLSPGVMAALSSWIKDIAESSTSNETRLRLLGHVIKIVNEQITPEIYYPKISPGYLAKMIRSNSEEVRQIEDRQALVSLADLLDTKVRPSVDQQHGPAKQKEFYDKLLPAVEILDNTIAQNDGKISNKELAQAYMYLEAACLALEGDSPKLPHIKRARKDLERAGVCRFYAVIEAPIADCDSNIQAHFREHRSLINMKIYGVGPKTIPKLEDILGADSIKAAILNYIKVPT
jgi:hypothetical protein